MYLLNNYSNTISKVTPYNNNKDAKIEFFYKNENSNHSGVKLWSVEYKNNL